MRILLFFLTIGLPSNAFAHLGHLGELAGHSHWIALGAGVVAVAIAGLLANAKDDEESAEEEEVDQEPELEGAAN